MLWGAPESEASTQQGRIINAQGLSPLQLSQLNSEAPGFASFVDQPHQGPTPTVLPVVSFSALVSAQGKADSMTLGLSGGEMSQHLLARPTRTEE